MNKMTVAILALALTGSVAFAQGRIFLTFISGPLYLISSVITEHKQDFVFRCKITPFLLADKITPIIKGTATLIKKAH